MNLLKTSIAALAAFFALSHAAHAQAEYFVGMEAGGISDRNHFTAETGQELGGGTLGNIWGLSFGLRRNGFTVASGFMRYRHGWRFFDLDRSTGIFDSPAMSGYAGKSFVIPLTVSKEFNLYNHWHAGIGAGIAGLITGSDRFSARWDKFSEERDANNAGTYSLSADSTVTLYGTDRKFDAAVETSVYLLYKIGGGGEFFSKLSYQAHLHPLFEAEHTFYAADGAMQGTSRAQNSWIWSVGLRFFFNKAEDSQEE